MTPSWSDEVVDSTKYQIYRPSHPHEQGPVLCYFRDEDNSLPLMDPGIQQWLDQHGLTVVAPEHGPLWSLDVESQRGLPRDYLLKEILPAVESVAPAPVAPSEFHQQAEKPRRIALMGEGMGGQAALRLAYDYPDEFPVVVAVQPKVDFHLHVRFGHDLLSQQFEDEEAARQHTAILHVHPLHWPRHHYFCADPMNDPWYDGAERLRQKLAASGVLFECELEESADQFEGTYFQMMAPRLLKFCQQRLQREWLRIV